MHWSETTVSSHWILTTMDSPKNQPNFSLTSSEKQSPSKNFILKTTSSELKVRFWYIWFVHSFRKRKRKRQRQRQRERNIKLNVFVENDSIRLGIVMILNALKDNKTIRELTLTQNTLGDEGINALCEMLKTVYSWIHLFLPNSF